MNLKLSLTLLLLILSCDNDPMSPKHGCLDSIACNYNPDASIDNNSCIYESEDCLGICGGDNIEDECGVCNNSIEDDCIQDECGVWGGDGSTCNPLIRGYVYSSSGNPVENAYIFLGLDFNITSRPTMAFSLSLANSGNVNMWIENSCNEYITTLTNEYYELGTHTIYWDGTNANGLLVLDGFYKTNIMIDNEILTGQLLFSQFGSCSNCTSNETSIPYHTDYCFNSNSNEQELICEHLTTTNSNGYFEFSPDCIGLENQSTATDEFGNELGILSIWGIRLFADNGEEFGSSHIFQVDQFNGAEITITTNIP